MVKASIDPLLPGKKKKHVWCVKYKLSLIGSHSEMYYNSIGGKKNVSSIFCMIFKLNTALTLLLANILLPVALFT